MSANRVVGSIVVVAGMLAGTYAHAEHRITTAVPREEVAGPRKPIDLHIARTTVVRETARAAPVLNIDFSIEHPAAEEKEWHPRWYVKPMSRMSAAPTPHRLVPCDRQGADAGAASITGLTLKLRF